jgi:hypothetical protein
VRNQRDAENDRQKCRTRNRAIFTLVDQDSNNPGDHLPGSAHFDHRPNSRVVGERHGRVAPDRSGIRAEAAIGSYMKHRRQRAESGHDPGAVQEI